MCVSKQDRGSDVAAKKIELDGSTEGKTFVMREARALQRVKHHPYILRLLHHQFIDDVKNKIHEFWIITEFCQGGSYILYLTLRPKAILITMDPMVVVVAVVEEGALVLVVAVTVVVVVVVVVVQW